MTKLEILNLIAIFSSPVAAVCITLWHQNRQEKRTRQEAVFIKLMGHRKANPPTHDWVTSLNLIDVIFSNCPDVVKLWHEYFAMLCDTKTTNFQPREHKYLQLLTAMSRHLGYDKLEQVDIDKFYWPQASVNQQELQYNIQQEVLRVLRNSEMFGFQVVQNTNEPPVRTVAAPLVANVE